MPWLFKSMKDVAVSEKRRGGDKQPVIRRFPNGETQVEFSTYTPKFRGERTIRTETS